MADRLPDHVYRLINNINDVKTLVHLYSTLGKGKRGPKKGIEILNRSSIVLITACWESYIEDLAKISFNYMLNNASDPKVFPDKVKTLASKELRNSSNETKIWQLAEGGWKKIMKLHRKKIIEKHIDNFHSPESTNVDQLFERLIGFKKISQKWKWKGMREDAAALKLDNIIKRRHGIAHRVTSGKSVTQTEVDEAIKFIQKISAVSSNWIGAYIKSRTGKEPWAAVAYRGIG